MKTQNWIGIAVLGTISGITPAQQPPADHAPRAIDRQDRNSTKSGEATFARSNQILGAEVRDRGDKAEKLGTIKDLAIEKSNGRVAYAIVTSGGVLGVGAKERVVALPRGSCTITGKDGEKRECVYTLSRQELESAPAWDDKLMDEFYRRHSKTVDASDVRTGEPRPARDPKDAPVPAGRQVEGAPVMIDSPEAPYETAFSAKKETTVIKGKITQIVDKETYVCAYVADENAPGRTVKVVLGPQTYVTSQGWTPTVGEKVEVTGVEYANPKNNETSYVVTSVKRESGNVQFRDLAGTPAWVHRTKQDKAASPVCLASKIDGLKVKSANDKIGSIKDLFFEANGSHLAFVTVSTDHGDLVIPWGALSCGADETLQLKIGSDQIKAAPKLTNKALTDAENVEFRTRLYKFYAIEQPHWDRQTAATPDRR